MKFIFVILCLVVVSNECLAKKCTENDMSNCLSQLLTVIQHLARAQETGEDFTIYCPKLEQRRQCIRDCEADFPKVSKLISMLDFVKIEFCGENGKMHVAMTPCFQDNTGLFAQCKRGVFSPDEVLCNMVDSTLCIARFIKEKCENGKAYGNALEKRMMKRIHTCSGAGHLANSLLTFATTVLSILLIRNRLQ